MRPANLSITHNLWLFNCALLAYYPRFAEPVTFNRGIDMDSWVAQELGGGVFRGQRREPRLRRLLGDLGQQIGATVPLACQDWAATKAAYRFFDNPRVDEGLILAGHFLETAARFQATTGPILVLHDTTEF